MSPSTVETSSLTRLIRSALLVAVFAIRPATAQSHDAAFGELRRLELPSPVTSIQSLTPWTSGHAVLAAFAPERHLVFRIPVDTSWRIGAVTASALPVPFDDALVVELEENGRSVVVFTDRAGKQVHVVTSLSGDTLHLVQSITLPVAPVRIIAGDVTNDRRKDLLVWDNGTPGLVPLVAQGNGRFLVRRTLAPDNAIGTCAVASLNDDDLADIILFDWVRSELHMLYGVGGGRFIDQSTFAVTGDVRHIVPFHMPKNLPASFALGFHAPDGVEIWNGTPFGDFAAAQHCSLDAVPLELRVLADGSGRRGDLLALLPGGDLRLFRNEGGLVSDSLRLSIPISDRMLLSSSAAALMPDLLFSAGTNVVWVLRDAAKVPEMHDSIDYVTGREPTAVLASDLNHDGFTDAVVTCAGGRSVSIYWGRGPQGFTPDPPHMLAGRPSSIALHHLTDSSASFLVASEADQSVTYGTFSFDGESSVTADVPTEGTPGVLTPFPGEQGMPGFAVLNALPTDDRFAMSIFTQVAGERFLEQSFRLAAPNVLLGASTADLARDGYPGIVYAYRASDTTAIILAAAYGDSARTFRRHAILQELPVRQAKSVHVWAADLNGDDTLDILVYCAAPAREFFFLRGRSNGSFDVPIPVVSGIDVRDYTDVRFADLAHDGRKEIVVLERSQERIVWFRPVTTAEDSLHVAVEHTPVQAFALGDFLGTGMMDLAAILRAPDRLRIYSGAGRWGRTAILMGEGPR